MKKVTAFDQYFEDANDYFGFSLVRKSFTIKVPNYEVPEGTHLAISHNHSIVAISTNKSVIFVKCSTIYTLFYQSGENSTENYLLKPEDIECEIKSMGPPQYIMFIENGDYFILSTETRIMKFDTNDLSKPLVNRKLPGKRTIKSLEYNPKVKKFLINLHPSEGGTPLVEIWTDRFSDVRTIKYGVIGSFLPNAPTGEFVCMKQENGNFCLEFRGEDNKVFRVFELENVCEVFNMKWMCKDFIVFSGRATPREEKAEEGEGEFDDEMDPRIFVFQTKDQTAIAVDDCYPEEGESGRRNPIMFSEYFGEWNVSVSMFSNSAEPIFFAHMTEKGVNCANVPENLSITFQDKMPDGMVFDFTNDKETNNLFGEPEKHAASPTGIFLNSKGEIIIARIINKFARTKYKTIGHPRYKFYSKKKKKSTKPSRKDRKRVTVDRDSINKRLEEAAKSKTFNVDEAVNLNYEEEKKKGENIGSRTENLLGSVSFPKEEFNWGDNNTDEEILGNLEGRYDEKGDRGDTDAELLGPKPKDSPNEQKMTVFPGTKDSSTDLPTIPGPGQGEEIRAPIEQVEEPKVPLEQMVIRVVASSVGKDGKQIPVSEMDVYGSIISELGFTSPTDIFKVYGMGVKKNISDFLLFNEDRFLRLQDGKFVYRKPRIPPPKEESRLPPRPSEDPNPKNERSYDPDNVVRLTQAVSEEESNKDEFVEPERIDNPFDPHPHPKSMKTKKPLNRRKKTEKKKEEEEKPVKKEKIVKKKKEVVKKKKLSPHQEFMKQIHTLKKMHELISRELVASQDQSRKVNVAFSRMKFLDGDVEKPFEEVKDQIVTLKEKHKLQKFQTKYIKEKVSRRKKEEILLGLQPLSKEFVDTKKRIMKHMRGIGEERKKCVHFIRELSTPVTPSSGTFDDEKMKLGAKKVVELEKSMKERVRDLKRNQEEFERIQMLYREKRMKRGKGVGFPEQASILPTSVFDVGSLMIEKEQFRRKRRRRSSYDPMMLLEKDPEVLTKVRRRENILKLCSKPVVTGRDREGNVWKDGMAPEDRDGPEKEERLKYPNFADFTVTNFLEHDYITKAIGNVTRFLYLYHCPEEQSGVLRGKRLIDVKDFQDYLLAKCHQYFKEESEPQEYKLCHRDRYKIRFEDEEPYLLNLRNLRIKEANKLHKRRQAAEDDEEKKKRELKKIEEEKKLREKEKETNAKKRESRRKTYFAWHKHIKNLFQSSVDPSKGGITQAQVLGLILDQYHGDQEKFEKDEVPKTVWSVFTYYEEMFVELRKDHFVHKSQLRTDDYINLKRLEWKRQAAERAAERAELEKKKKKEEGEKKKKKKKEEDEEVEGEEETTEGEEEEEAEEEEEEEEGEEEDDDDVDTSKPVSKSLKEKLVRQKKDFEKKNPTTVPKPQQGEIAADLSEIFDKNNKKKGEDPSEATGGFDVGDFFPEKKDGAKKNDNFGFMNELGKKKNKLLPSIHEMFKEELLDKKQTTFEGTGTELPFGDETKKDGGLPTPSFSDENIEDEGNDLMNPYANILNSIKQEPKKKKPGEGEDDTFTKLLTGKESTDYGVFGDGKTSDPTNMDFSNSFNPTTTDQPKEEEKKRTETTTEKKDGEGVTTGFFGAETESTEDTTTTTQPSEGFEAPKQPEKGGMEDEGGSGGGFEGGESEQGGGGGTGNSWWGNPNDSGDGGDGAWNANADDDDKNDSGDGAAWNATSNDTNDSGDGAWNTTTEDKKDYGGGDEGGNVWGNTGSDSFTDSSNQNNNATFSGGNQQNFSSDWNNASNDLGGGGDGGFSGFSEGGGQGGFQSSGDPLRRLWGEK